MRHRLKSGRISGGRRDSRFRHAGHAAFRASTVHLGLSLEPAALSISRERFSLALERLKSSDWETFEVLASTFLAAEFGKLRTLASSSGDDGQDAVLLGADDEPETVFQYSVTEHWAPKIRATVKRLTETGSLARSLIYVSNQAIGAQADKLKRELRKNGLSLDIKDVSFFLERAETDTARINAAADLARRIVDPYLENRGVLADQGVLSGREANTALLYIEMQQQDEASGKGLTRSCFEALTKAALHGTTREKRITKSEVHRRVHAFLPQHEPAILAPFVDAALRRLKRKSISQWTGQIEEEFHINHPESELIKDASARLLGLRQSFEKDVTDIVTSARDAIVSEVCKLIDAVSRILQV